MLSARHAMQVVMILWSYFTALTTDPGRVPEGWHPFSNARVGSLAVSSLVVHNRKCLQAP
jgi:hypothetical protein